MAGMMILNGLLAGLIAGACMGIISEAGYRAGIFKSSLFIIDGVFTGKLLHRESHVFLDYLLGISIHLVTSIAFGLVYASAVLIIGLRWVTVSAIGIYTLLLWLAMLFIALPIAGWGLLGRKIHRNVWMEQLFIHIIFGIVFYEVLLLL